MPNRSLTTLLATVLTACVSPACPPEGCGDGPCELRDCGVGACVDTTRGAYCDCPSGYHEELATCVASPTDCAGVDCGAGACELSSGVATCRCDPGYVARGLRCEAAPDDPCELADCGTGTCIAEAGGARCECPTGQRAVGLRCVGDTAPATSGLFVELPETGLVDVTLHPDPSIVGDAVWVSFGVPFPRGALVDLDRILLTDEDGTEIAVHVEELVRWRSLGDPSVDSVRAVRVSFQRTFASSDPVGVVLHWGSARTASIATAPAAHESWIGPVTGEYPSGEGVYEPAVYATLPPSWLGAALLRTRATPAGEEADLTFMDALLPRFSETAINHVDPRVTADNLIDYVGDSEPWLFDRASTLFNAYVRTGELRWLRSAHRATQFYAQHIGADGYFDLKPGDLKYAYGASMLSDVMLTGDARLIAPIERVAIAGESFNPRYTITTGFWTERHLAYALLAALTAWEATGGAGYASRVEEIVAAISAHVASPPAGWTPQGCLLHTMRAHEGNDSSEPICSPWMSALLADAVFRYYVGSEDERALTFLAGLAEFVRDHALYDAEVDGPHLAGLLVPWYLVSSSYQFTDSGAWADFEHGCDVAGLVARGAWARRQLGGDSSSLVATTDSLLATCARNLDHWVRPGGPDAGLAEYRLSPPRKYNWWFGTTSDLGWLLSELRD